MNIFDWDNETDCDAKTSASANSCVQGCGWDKSSTLKPWEAMSRWLAEFGAKGNADRASKVFLLLNYFSTTNVFSRVELPTIIRSMLREENHLLMLAATGVDYDEAVPGFPSEVTHLSEPEHLAKLRADGMLMMNQVPLLCIDGLRLVQSRAIVRYLAERGGLCGDGSARQRVECDVMAESVHDWKDATCSSFEYGMNGFEPNERQLRKIKKGNARFLPILEQRLSRDGKAHDFLVGSAMTYADVLMLEVLEQIVPADPGCLAAFPGVQRLHQRLREVPRIARWLNSDRRKTKTQAEVAPYKALVKHTCSF